MNPANDVLTLERQRDVKDEHSKEFFTVKTY